MFKKRSEAVWNTRTIVMLALMAAINIVLTRYLAINVGGFFRLSMGSIATVLTGMWFGPAAGFAVGAASDLVGLMLVPSGALNPLITISAGMWGLIPGCFAGFVRGTRKQKIGIICALVIITSVVCQLGLTSAALIMMFGTGIIPSRLIQFICSTPVYCVVVSALYLSPLTGVVGTETAERLNCRG